MLKLDTVEQSWLNDYRQALDSNFPDLVEDIVIFGSKARGDAGPDSDLDVLVVIREADRQTKSEVRRIGHLLSVMSDALPSIVVYTRAEWQERARRLTLLPGRNARWSTRSTNRKSVIAEWRRAVESMGDALSCRRDGYHADSISRAYYAIMHAARSSLQLYDVTAESHAGVRRMFGQHLVRPGLVEPEWGVAISDLRRNDGRVLKLQDSLETAGAAEGAYDRQVEPLPHQTSPAAF